MTKLRPVSSKKVPRFSGICTFLRLPHVEEPTGVDIAIIGVPFDGGQTTTVSGARFAPRAIREASARIKPYNPSLDVNPYEKYNVADCGDVFINPLDLEMSRKSIADGVGRFVEAGAVPLCVGGDHSVTLPILRGVARRHKPVGLVFFDAHSDSSDEYFGSRYGAGTPVRRAIEEGLVDPKRTLQIGIRGSLYSADEHDYALAQGVEILTADDILEHGIKWVVERYTRVAGGPLYVSIDMDVLDPAFAPATAPNPGGLSTRELLYLIRKLRGQRIVGADITEVNSPYDTANKMSCCLAAQLLFEFVCIVDKT
jgi:guanidinopropionase